MGKHAGGRPTKYRKEFVQRLDQYISLDFQNTIDIETTDSNGNTKQYQKITPPAYCPTREGFAIEIGVDTDTLINWGNEHKEFFGALTRLDHVQKQFLLQNGLTNTYNDKIAQFLLINNHGMKSARTDNTHDVSVKNQLTPEQEQAVADGIRERYGLNKSKE
jgi:hypothetical protein